MHITIFKRSNRTKMPSATVITNSTTTIAAETPISFTDIPPVLRHKEDNVSATLDPPLEGFSAQDGTQGTLYIIERFVSCLLVFSHHQTIQSSVLMSDMRELSIVPQSAASLEPIFEALSRCAALHPDKATASDEEDMDAFIDPDNGGFEVFTGDEDQELSEVGRAALAHLESIIYYPEDQPAANGAVNGNC
ncbi:hypothetical protein C8F04DRAFT_1085660 [Mycena alexandri]|uniref:Uncharacterized protein n=1 Tax=Mycena alexandri TaxID=1745969 RepID=A0AAD6T612_9AGAR|nr:hypothetical protein C8F04DRAFT_1085660 [Mycena alexandri]